MDETPRDSVWFAALDLTSRKENVTKDEILNASGASERVVVRTLNNMVEYGILDVERGGGRGRKTKYQINSVFARRILTVQGYIE